MRGRLLVASPALVDPNFDRAVVLIIEHTDEGALGVVLNRPSPTSVTEALPEWADLAASPAQVFIGGPVDPTAVIAVGRHSAASPPAGVAPIEGDLGVLDLHVGTDALAPYVASIRVFAGYAGWGAGQLEDEIEEGAWYVLDAMDEDVLADDPTELWWTILGRQPGRLRKLRLYPPRLHWN